MSTGRIVLALWLAIGTTLLAQQAPDRSHPPQSGPPPALNLPAIQKLQLANGLPVWIVEQHKVPVVQVNLLVLSGTAEDPAGKCGAAKLSDAMPSDRPHSQSRLETCAQGD